MLPPPPLTDDIAQLTATLLYSETCHLTMSHSQTQILCIVGNEGVRQGFRAVFSNEVFMKQSIDLPSDGITSTTSTSSISRQTIIPSVLPAKISKRFLFFSFLSFFLVKPKKGHANNTQGQWWEPASLPVIIHLFVELMTVAGGRELGASSHVMSPTHAKGL